MGDKPKSILLHGGLDFHTERGKRRRAQGTHSPDGATFDVAIAKLL